VMMMYPVMASATGAADADRCTSSATIAAEQGSLALSPYISNVLLCWGPLVQCDCCPRCWTCVELLSRHYTCAERNSLAVHSVLKQREKVAVGDKVC
jgi:hypothetical protein